MEHITILFTDIVGSTEMASSLMPAEANEVRQRHFAALRDAIVAADAREIKNLGDGLMVVCPGAGSALRCAVTMQQAVDRDQTVGGAALQLRVGISAGDATHEDGDYFGEPVVEAARLCGLAEGGQILVTDLVRVGSGRRSEYAFSSLGELELKGLPDPVPVWSVGWDPLPTWGHGGERIALPTRLAISPTVGVVGRVSETEVLAETLKQVAASGVREVVLVSGEPGVGKTTLLSQAARIAFDTGADVLLGRCDEDVSAPYQPFAEALRHLVTQLPPEMLSTYVESSAAELTRIVPEISEILQELPSPRTTDPDTERYLLFAAVVGLLQQISATRPLLLVLDDLHWADKPSLQLLRHLVSVDAPLRLLVVASYRDSELSAGHPLTETLASLRREQGVSRIELKGFDDNDVIAFMEAAAGHALEDDGVQLAHAVYRETDGNPFFVGEVLRNLSETGAIYQAEDGHWTASANLAEAVLPDSVREVIGSRAARLGEPAGQVLSTAAVIGRDFDIDVLARATALSEDDLLDILDGASLAALLHEVPDQPGRFSFAHALIQHTLYQDLGATRRSRAHRLIAETLEELYGEESRAHLGELARHWAAATQPADSAKVLHYASRAGAAALEALAPDQAIPYFTQALALVDQQFGADPVERAGLLLGLGTAQRQAGVGDWRQTLLDAAGLAEQAGATEILVQAALSNNRGFFSELGAVDAERIGAIEAALRALPDGDSPDRARLLARQVSELVWGPFEQRRELLEAAREMAIRLGDPGTLVQVLNDCAIARRLPLFLDQQLADEKHAFGLAQDLGDPVVLYWAALHFHCDSLRAGNFDDAEYAHQVLYEIGQRLQQPMLVWTEHYMQAALAMMTGDAVVAERRSTEALDIGVTGGQPDATSFHVSQMLAIAFMRGGTDQVADLTLAIVDQYPNIPAFKATLALAYLCQDRPEEARRLLDEVLGSDFDFPLDTAWLNGLINFGFVAIWLNHVEACERLFSMLSPYAGQVPYEGLDVFPPVAVFVAGLASIIGRYDEAETFFEAAHRLTERGGMKYADTLTRLLRGRMLLARGGQHAAQGIELLEQARGLAAKYGYGLLERTVAKITSS